MSTYIYKLNQQISDIIYIQSAGSPVTGLVNANFTKYLMKDGAAAAETITVTEINAGTRPGIYAVTFTPTAGVGDYQYLVYATSYSDSKFTENFEVRAVFSDFDSATNTVTLAAATHTGAVIPTVTTVTGAVGSVTGAVGSVTGNVGGNVVGSVGSVVGAVGSVTGNVGGNLVGNVNGNVVGSVGSVSGAVGSVTAAVTVGTNNDKTGYRLSATGVDDIWDEAQTGHETASTTGGNLASAKYHVANKATIASGAYTVYKDDGTTSFKTGTTSASDGNRTPS